MNDYKDLITKLRENSEWADANIYEVPIMLLVNFKQAADVIEQLVKERDAAIADIEKYCRYCIVCKNADFTDDYTHNRCRKCLDEDNRYFEWRGVQEAEHEID